MKTILLALLILLVATPALSLVRITYVWTAPTTGTPVEYYVCETRWQGEDWGACSGTASSEIVTIDTFDGVLDFQLRVAGVDSFERQGPWSEASDPYHDVGAPGKPGDPTVESIVHITED